MKRTGREERRPASGGVASPAQRDDDDRHLPGHQWGHPNSLCFESPRLDPYVSFKTSSQLAAHSPPPHSRATPYSLCLVSRVGEFVSFEPRSFPPQPPLLVKFRSSKLLADPARNKMATRGRLGTASFATGDMAAAVAAAGAAAMATVLGATAATTAEWPGRLERRTIPRGLGSDDGDRAHSSQTTKA